MMPMPIVVDNLCVSFGGKKVLDKLSLSLPDQGLVCLLGPSGCGKTTLLRVLAGLQTATGGNVSGLTGRRMAMVFQEDRLLPWFSAAQNVALAVDGDLDLAHAALRRMELTEAADLLPAQLSGGMRKRVAIARALAFGGDVLLLDEPSAGLDQELTERILEQLKQAWQGGLIVLVTHEKWLAQSLSGQVVHMERPQGKVQVNQICCQ